MAQHSVWTIEKPFDSLILKFWSPETVTEFVDSLAAPSHSELVEALVPNKQITDYFRNEILSEIFIYFCRSPNICDQFKFCQNVTRHSTGLACVTAAGIRKRLDDHYSIRLGMLLNRDFQHRVWRQSNTVTQRHNIGVLVFDCPNDENQYRKHAMEVLFENFFLYTTPVIEKNMTPPNIENVKHFILMQIARNTDCVIIFVDQVMVTRLNDTEDVVNDILINTVSWNYKIKIIIISICRDADNTATNLFKELISLRPVIVLYDQFIMAPTGGLIALVKNSCKLSVKNAFLKYWYRGWTVLNPLSLRRGDIINERQGADDDGALNV